MGNNIVFFVNTMNYGGAAKMLTYVADICRNIFDGVTIVSCYNDINEENKREGMTYINLGIKAGGIPTWRIPAMIKIRRMVKKLNAQYVCGWASEMAFMVRTATIGLSNTIISAERNDPYVLSYFWKVLEHWTYKNSDYAFFQLEKAMVYYGDAVSKKSFVIPNPFISNFPVSNIRNRNRNKTIVSAGRFREQKGFDVLIKAFAKVYKNHPDYKLIIYGEGPLESQYKQLAKELGVANALLLPGYINNLEKDIVDEGIFVLSSRFEGIPNTLIEAMSTGIPTVSTDCSPGGPDFLTNHGERGLLVKVDDVDGMANALTYLMDHEEEASALGLKGLEVVEMLEEKKITTMWRNAFLEIKDKQLKYD